MGRKRRYRIFACDFETTVYTGQEYTEVWSSAFVELYKNDEVTIHHSLTETFNYFVSLKENIILYYHNLKFDGSFWLYHLIYNTELKPCVIKDKDDNIKGFTEDKNQPNNTYKYAISALGQWYFIRVKVNDKIIEIRDSLKLLPMKLKKIGEGFHTQHQKLDMEYVGFRYAGCEITPEEQEYIRNDVLVLKEALEIMYESNHNKLTIGACCMSEFRLYFTKEQFKAFFPNMGELICYLHHDINVDTWIRRSYKGGWCYLKDGYENKVVNGGITADVNSLYPSVMHSESRNRYPIGNPAFWKGNYIPNEALDPTKYYFIEIETQFYLKEGKLPFIQIKGDPHYKATEALKTSEWYNSKTNTYTRYYYGEDNQKHDIKVNLVLTMTDYKLMLDHYDLIDCKIIGGAYFDSVCGLFDQYINEYAKIKQESNGAPREIAKLFLNNLYGKFATSDDSSFKYAFKYEDIYKFMTVEEHEKKLLYIPIGSAVTSYARDFTIRHAQANYKYFIYADTDSIHCCCTEKELKNIAVDPVKFLHWKLETSWNKGLFVRQKTYIEHVTHENLQPVEDPYYNVKCAGMNERCKDLFLSSMGEKNVQPKTPAEVEFLKVPRTLTDFKKGLKIPSKLTPVLIRGGVLLKNTTYELR